MIDQIDMKSVLNVIDLYSRKVDLTAHIPLSEYEQRYKKVWEALEKRNIDLGFFFWYREMPGDGIYLTGYNPTIERASAVIAPGKRPMLLVGPESGILSREVGLNLETHFTTEFSIPDEYYEDTTCDSLPEVTRNYVGHRISKIGYLTSYDIIPAKFMDVLLKDIDEDVEVIDASDILEELRYEKSENEFKCMEQANIIANAAIRAMLAVAKPGMRETEIAAVADFVVKALGGCGYGLETIVAAGERCRSVIGPASNRVINKDEIVQIGVSPSYEGYKGVCRRAFVMGQRSAIQKEYFEIMNEGFRIAHSELINVVENDLPINLIDIAPREFFASKKIENYNMKQCHFYSTCHGTGLTECLEKQVVHPEIPLRYGNNIGIMLDLAQYGHPNSSISGGCVEDAFHKKSRSLFHLTDLPIDVQELVGKSV